MRPRDAACASFSHYHLMAMSDDDSYTPPHSRSGQSSRTRAPGRGPVIDQYGRELPEANLHTQFEGVRFDFGHSAANPFGDLTREQRLARLDAIAKLLDVAFIVPGTNVRYGLDGLIGLIPVIGDIITTAIALWVVREARALGAPRYLVARMLANVAVDGAVGAVPLIGDAFDIAFKANVRNVRMLRKWM